MHVQACSHKTCYSHGNNNRLEVMVFTSWFWPPMIWAYLPFLSCSARHKCWPSLLYDFLGQRMRQIQCTPPHSCSDRGFSCCLISFSSTVSGNPALITLD